MNNIINLSQLITRLAKVTDTDPNTARRFLRTFFATIEEVLAEGETVEIKGIGTFMRCDDPAVGTPGSVGFAPADDFAEEINRPFAVFEAVELADGLTAEDLEPEITETPAEEPEIDVPAEITDIAEDAETVVEPTIPAETEENVSATAAETEEEHKAPWEIYGKGPFTIEEKQPETISETIEENLVEAPEEVSAFEDTPMEESVADPEDNEDDLDEEEKTHSRTWIWIACAILVVGAIAGYFAAVVSVPIPKYGEDETEQNEITPEPTAESIIVEELALPAPQETEQTQTAAPEPVIEEPAPTTPAKEPKYDTVTSKRYLAIMAREYYGRSIYWVFIYEANADKINDPNKVAPGTRVLIPDKESLPGSTDAERMSIAEKKAAEIQAKFK